MEAGDDDCDDKDEDDDSSEDGEDDERNEGKKDVADSSCPPSQALQGIMHLMPTLMKLPPATLIRWVMQLQILLLLY